MKYHSNGKLLLTGEYLVLEGATALALPTRLGQSMEVNPIDGSGIEWTSLDEEGQPWVKGRFLMGDGKLKIQQSAIGGSEKLLEQESMKRLQQLLEYAHLKNPEVLGRLGGYEVITKLDFHRSWGLGSSSTLVNNIAQWFEVDAFDLLENSFGGSGYDIASAQRHHPITYGLTAKGRSVFSASFDPPFKNQLFFVHQNRKQNSRYAITHFRNQPKSTLQAAVDKVDRLTQQFIRCTTLEEFELLIDIHETLLSGILDIPKIKAAQFNDYPGAVKSLGAWGGDFMLVTGEADQMNYFREKGFETIFSYKELIL